MCELLGMSFNQIVKPRISFQALQERDTQNPDGWGLAFYPDTAVQIFKEPIKARSSALAKFVKNYRKIQARTFIAHVRHASIGNKQFKNTHPFCRELKGKAYAFAHNGTIKNYQSLILEDIRPIGTTDSEYILCYLLTQMNQRNIRQWRQTDLRWLAATLKKINHLGTLNCLFSDGTHLFCYRDEKGFNALSYLRQEKASQTVGLLDRDFHIRINAQNREGYIVATRPLSKGQWKTCPKGNLLVFKHGRLIFSSH